MYYQQALRCPQNSPHDNINSKHGSENLFAHGECDGSFETITVGSQNNLSIYHTFLLQ